MAKRFRLSSLNQESQDKLNQFLYQYLPVNLHEQAKDALDKTGTIPDELLQQAAQAGTIDAKDIPAVKNNFVNIANKLPSAEQAYTNELSSVKDEGAATDEELQNRIGAYQGLGQTGPVVDPAQAGRTVDGLLSSYGVPSGMRYDKELRSSLSEFIGSARRLPDANELSSLLSKKGLKSTEIQTLMGFAPLSNLLTDQNAKNQVSQPLQAQDYTGDVKRINDLLGTRATQREKDSATNDFLTALPGQLKASRDEYLGGEADRANSEFQDYAPQAMAQLNSRGLLFSGSPEDLLTQKATNLAGGLDDLQSQLENEDNQFYFNAAYQNTLKTELASRSDYQSALSDERNRIMSDRANRFASTQSNYDNQLKQELNTSDLQRNYNSNAANLKRQSDLASNARKGDLFSSIGSSIGAVGGAAVGGPVGSAVGSTAGATIGKEVG